MEHHTEIAGANLGQRTSEVGFSGHLRRIALTFTGGIDSTTMAYWLGSSYDKPWYLGPKEPPPEVRGEVHLVAANYGQANWGRTSDLLMHHIEILRLRFPRINWQAAAVNFSLPSWDQTNATLSVGGTSDAELAIDYTRNEEHTYEDVFIDGRNMMLFAYLLSWCSRNKISALLVGHQYEEREWDQLDSWKIRTEDISPMFLDRINLMNECGFRYRTRVHAPWTDLRLTKYQIVKLATQLGVPLEQTYSCIHDPACGKCDNCLIRTKALAVNGIAHA